MKYVDLQINGCFGVDFNDDLLSQEEFCFACEKLLESNTDGFLATIITDNMEAMLRRLKNVAQYLDASSQENTNCLGIHVEGPFLSSEAGFVGAHPAQYTSDANKDDALRLLDAAGGYLKLLTLAPERDPGGLVTKIFTDAGVVVSAGHTDASREQIMQCVDQGLAMITHLGNACPNLLQRHDNILWRLLSVGRDLYVGLIADRHHLPVWLLPVLVDYFGTDRIVLVSDAISAAGLGPGTYTLGARTVTIGESGVARDLKAEHFVGATALLTTAEEVMWELGYSESCLKKMLHDNARSLLRC